MNVNGKTGEYLRWLLGLGLAALISYFTSLNMINEEVTRVYEREDAHFGEVLRRLDAMQVDIREIRAEHHILLRNRP